MSSKEAVVGSKEAAAMLGVSVSTIQKMVESGKLRAWRTQGGHRRISEADVRATSRDGQKGSGPHAIGQSLSVLVVEDSPLMVKSYSKAAATWGSEVEISFASDAAAALLRIAQRRPDLVITDLMMSPFDGFHLIKTIRASSELADTRVLVVTGLTKPEIEAKGGLDELTTCYHKPLSMERLGGYIDARLQDRHHRK